MCGRYIFYDEQNIDILNLIRKAADLLPAEVFEEIPLGEVFPGSLCFAGCLSSRNTLHTEVMRWGMTGFHGNTVINARSETCFESRFFQGTSRCVLPACGYYEWDAQKQKFLFQVKDTTIYMAGLYRKENGENRFVILTEPSSGAAAAVHPRQPVIFAREKAKAWCTSSDPMLLLQYSIAERTAVKA